MSQDQGQPPLSDTSSPCLAADPATRPRHRSEAPLPTQLARSSECTRGALLMLDLSATPSPPPAASAKPEGCGAKGSRTPDPETARVTQERRRQSIPGNILRFFSIGRAGAKHHAAQQTAGDCSAPPRKPKLQDIFAPPDDDSSSSGSSASAPPLPPSPPEERPAASAAAAAAAAPTASARTLRHCRRPASLVCDPVGQQQQQQQRADVIMSPSRKRRSGSVEISARFARAGYTAADETELTLEPGEAVCVKDADENGWAFGVTSRAKGWFPLDVLVPVPARGSSGAGGGVTRQRSATLESAPRRAALSRTMAAAPQSESIAAGEVDADVDIDMASIASSREATAVGLSDFLQGRPTTTQLEAIGILQERDTVASVLTSRLSWRANSEVVESLLRSRLTAAAAAADAAEPPAAAGEGSAKDAGQQQEQAEAPQGQQQQGGQGASAGEESNSECSPPLTRKAGRSNTVTLAMAPVEIRKMVPVMSTATRDIRAAMEKFVDNPFKGIQMLTACGVIEDKPRSIATFLYNYPGLPRDKVGDYLGTKESAEVLREYMHFLNFSFLDFETALRRFLGCFRLPGEAQKIDRLMQSFAHKFHSQGSERQTRMFENADAAYVLAFYTIMLNTDVHNPSVKRKMTLSQFIYGAKQMNGGKDFPRELLEDIYYNIIDSDIKLGKPLYPHAVKEGWLHKDGRLAHRRWFLADPTGLMYFRAPDLQELKGRYPIEGMNLVLFPIVPGKRYRFSVIYIESNKQEELRLSVEREISYYAWIDALQRLTASAPISSESLANSMKPRRTSPLSPHKREEHPPQQQAQPQPQPSPQPVQQPHVQVQAAAANPAAATRMVASGAGLAAHEVLPVASS
eukprot:m51a1_g11900 putative ankyrin repeat-containing protein (859) ;mRNA; f:612080-616119